MAGAPGPTQVQGPLEIVSLVGTLSPDGVHLHAAVSDSQGRVTGGHLKSGSLIHTTAEIVVGELVGREFRRQPNEETGYPELVIT